MRQSMPSPSPNVAARKGNLFDFNPYGSFDQNNRITFSQRGNRTKQGTIASSMRPDAVSDALKYPLQASEQSAQSQGQEQYFYIAVDSGI